MTYVLYYKVHREQCRTNKREKSNKYCARKQTITFLNLRHTYQENKTKEYLFDSFQSLKFFEKINSVKEKFY